MRKNIIIIYDNFTYIYYIVSEVRSGSVIIKKYFKALHNNFIQKMYAIYYYINNYNLPIILKEYVNLIVKIFCQKY